VCSLHTLPQIIEKGKELKTWKLTWDGCEQNFSKSRGLTVLEVQEAHAFTNNIPLLCPLVSLSTVHSSIVPKGPNITLTSFSVHFFDSIPTNNFRSEKRKYKKN
jgi:hypothetical protein